MTEFKITICDFICEHIKRSLDNIYVISLHALLQFFDFLSVILNQFVYKFNIYLIFYKINVSLFAYYEINLAMPIYGIKYCLRTHVEFMILHLP